MRFILFEKQPLHSAQYKIKTKKKNKKIAQLFAAFVETFFFKTFEGIIQNGVKPFFVCFTIFLKHKTQILDKCSLISLFTFISVCANMIIRLRNYQ